ncbi:hypothetical protein L9F63_016591, partial [Diploptera punctata]
ACTMIFPFFLLTPNNDHCSIMFSVSAEKRNLIVYQRIHTGRTGESANRRPVNMRVGDSCCIRFT